MKIFTVFALIIFMPNIATFATCDDEAKKFLAELGVVVEPLSLAYRQEMWKFYTTSERGRLDELEDEFIAIFSDKENFKKVSDLKLCVADPLLKHRITRQWKGFLSGQGEPEFLKAMMDLENETHKILLLHRARFRGEEKTNEEIRKILRFSRDRAERESAWRALTEVGEKTIPGIRELAKMRNTHAKNLGYKNYYEMSLDLLEIKPAALEGYLKKLDRLSRKPYKEFLKERAKRLGLKKLEPWDMAFDDEGIRERIDGYFKKDAIIEFVIGAYKNFGLDISSMGIKVDAEPRPQKSQHAYSFSISVPDDVRILLNIDDGMGVVRTLLHEYGHATYAASVRQSEWDLKRSAGSILDEGVAQFFARLIENPKWLVEAAGVTPELAKRYEKREKDGNIAGIRGTLVSLTFEKMLYENPDADLNALWWRLAEKYIKMPRHDEVCPWGATVHYITHPVYLQNYLLADMIADQLWEYFLNRGFDAISDPRVGEFLTNEIFQRGASQKWDEIFKNSVGEPLNPRYYIRYRVGEDAK